MNAPPLRTREVAARKIGLAQAGDAHVARTVPVEAPVAIEYNGIGYAVMMATPADLEVYAIGLTLAEGLVADAAAIEGIDIHAVEGGWVVRVTLPAEAMAPVIARARTRVSESGCGLCGMESIEAVLSALPKVAAPNLVTREAIATALAALPEHQPLGRSTSATHAAAFCAPDGTIRHVCEDVGRHNALDKLVGTLARAWIDPADGFILLSARCSYELVEKTVRAGARMLVTISAPTSLAVDRAIEAGLTLVSLARDDSMLVLNDPHGMFA